MVVLRFLGILILSLALPAISFAAGGHDGLNCTGCHDIHSAKGPIIFAVPENKKSINPRTNQPFATTTALCLGCHETMEKGGLGIKAISAHISHPYGVVPNPKVAIVPEVFLRDGRLECVGCHDPHPSNTYHRYLRVETAKGVKMAEFCALCHSAKADPRVLKEMRIFDSMDQRKVSLAPALESPAVPEAAPKKKK
ncbi:MAG: cytochrome c3 family protein [Nitrospirota bacterium]